MTPQAMEEKEDQENKRRCRDLNNELMINNIVYLNNRISNINTYMLMLY